MSDTLIAPTAMSLPRAAELPVTQMGFPRTARRRLLACGITTALQLAEMASRHPQALKHLTGVTPTRARRMIEAELGRIPDFSGVAVAYQPLPAAGVPLNPPGVAAAGSGGDAGVAALAIHLDTLTNLPTRVSLVDRMQPVGNQGLHPTCVGWAANALREYSRGIPMSAGYAYRGAKARDGWHGGGSWLRFALEHFHLAGHLTETAYPYPAAIREEPIDPYADLAARARALGHAALPRHDAATLPRLMRSILAGRLDPGLPPLPIAIALRLYPSFTTTASALDGLIALPLPGETPTGGHAMTVVGYLDANDPSNPFGLGYFLVRNSWGATWAAGNPMGEPGHAFIPDAMFTRHGDLMEAWISIDTT